MKRHVVASYFCANDEAAVKVTLSESATHDEMREVGEYVARSELMELDPLCVFVWVYGEGMDPQGPAAMLTYMERGRAPSSAPIDARMLGVFYHRVPVAEG